MRTTKIIKRFYGVQGVLDEYRRQEFYKIGNTGFMALFCYTLISNVIVFVIVSLDNYKHVQDILICYMSINILFLTYGICGYVLIATRRRHLLENEVLDIQSQKLHLTFLATRQGIFLDYSIIYLMY